MTDHPMQPSAAQISEWREQARNAADHYVDCEVRIARTAYAAGADAQLEEYWKWLAERGYAGYADTLRALMRPKPPTLAEQALAILEDSRLDADHENCIRRALQRLAELEGKADG